MKKFYLTTPLYYPNARPHVGNSYTTMVCDAIARYKRLCGYDVAYLTGTDEHGEKLQRAATETGVTPQEFVASKRELFFSLWKLLNISYTHFIYTDRADHTRSVQRMLLRARANGYIDKRRYEGRYCVSDERYIADGTEPADCDICGRPAELISEENYFFKLSAFQNRLLELYEKHPEFVQPDFRRNEVVSFVKSGLRDISVSRKRIKWGIPWPDDPEQVFYVWYDALTGYMTGIGFAEGENGSAEFRHYWPADCHMVGKDIIRFHAVYWPAFLMAADLPVPATIFAHGWLTVGADKMSKSKGNVVYCEPIVAALGADPLRYYLMRDIPFGQDSSFTYEALVQRYNSDLANNVGNLASRTVGMLHRWFDGAVPSGLHGVLRDDAILEIDRTRELAGEAEEALVEYRRRFDSYNLSRGIESILRLASKVNKYLDETEPWAIERRIDPSTGRYATSGESRRELETILYATSEALRFIAVMSYPVIPHGGQRLWEQLGQKGDLGTYHIDELKWGGLEPGTQVGKAEPIFPRLDREKLSWFTPLSIPVRRPPGPTVPSGVAPMGFPGSTAADQEPDKPKEKSKAMQTESGKPPEATPTASPQPPAPSPATEKISIEDFAKVEMRVGEVVAAERVSGAQKLLKLMVDIGSEVRQVVAGIAEYYQPEQIVGMKVVLVVNLQPRKLRGIESNGMIVAAAVGEEGRPVLVTFKEEVEVGARLK